MADPLEPTPATVLDDVHLPPPGSPGNNDVAVVPEPPSPASTAPLLRRDESGDGGDTGGSGVAQVAGGVGTIESLGGLGGSSPDDGLATDTGVRYRGRLYYHFNGIVPLDLRQEAQAALARPGGSQKDVSNILRKAAPFQVRNPDGSVVLGSDTRYGGGTGATGRINEPGLPDGPLIVFSAPQRSENALFVRGSRKRAVRALVVADLVLVALLCVLGLVVRRYTVGVTLGLVATSVVADIIALRALATDSMRMMTIGIICMSVDFFCSVLNAFTYFHLIRHALQLLAIAMLYHHRGDAMYTWVSTLTR